MNNSMGKRIGMRDIRDPRTKTGWPGASGSVPALGPNRTSKIKKKDQTRTGEILEVSDQLQLVLKEGCVLPMVKRPNSAWGSIKTKTIGKTHPTLQTTNFFHHTPFTKS